MEIGSRRWPFTMPQDILGIRFALNVAIATVIVWYSLKYMADTNPIWAIASMVAASDPQVTEARPACSGAASSTCWWAAWSACCSSLSAAPPSGCCPSRSP